MLVVPSSSPRRTQVGGAWLVPRRPFFASHRAGHGERYLEACQDACAEAARDGEGKGIPLVDDSRRDPSGLLHIIAANPKHHHDASVVNPGPAAVEHVRIHSDWCPVSEGGVEHRENACRPVIFTPEDTGRRCLAGPIDEAAQCQCCRVAERCAVVPTTVSSTGQSAGNETVTGLLVDNILMETSMRNVSVSASSAGPSRHRTGASCAGIPDVGCGRVRVRQGRRRADLSINPFARRVRHRRLVGCWR